MEKNDTKRLVLIGIRKKGDKRFKIRTADIEAKPVIINYSAIINNTPTR